MVRVNRPIDFCFGGQYSSVQSASAIFHWAAIVWVRVDGRLRFEMGSKFKKGRVWRRIASSVHTSERADGGNNSKPEYFYGIKIKNEINKKKKSEEIPLHVRYGS